MLLALGWRRDADLIRNTGLVTLLMVVSKLFIVDLSELEAVWRILLFLGFGGLLLLLSYFFPTLWNPDAEPEEEGVYCPYQCKTLLKGRGGEGSSLAIETGTDDLVQHGSLSHRCSYRHVS